jgi:N-acetyl-anhydromuramyl-L-alanine amidase AmpD
LIAPDGHNYRLRKDEETAWHARGSNRNSLGLEFLVQGDHDYGTFIEALKTPYLTKLQYQTGVEQAREWIDLFNIGWVVRHSDLSPGRKVDPGHGFPWHKFLDDIGIA